jgi:mediator of RNA polymerase II transcription subunit 4
MALKLPETSLAGPSDISTDSIPPRTRLLQNITTQTHLINQIFTSLSSSSSLSSTAPNPLPALYQQLNDTAEELLRLRDEIAVHQELWARIEVKKRNVIDMEKRVRGIMRTLESERGDLETMVLEGREIMASVDKVETSEWFDMDECKAGTNAPDPIHIPSSLSHAHALAKHSSAPISSLLTPIDKAQYQPWPTENAMRQGLLFQMEGSMSGIGQTGQIGDGMFYLLTSYGVLIRQKPSRRMWSWLKLR